MNQLDFKHTVIAHCKSVISDKIERLQQELTFIAEDIAEDTKSSAGDKYETSREMANIEKVKLSNQLALQNKSLQILNNQPANTSGTIQAGSLIETDISLIYIAVSLGLQDIDGSKVIIISPSAPLAQILLGKKDGESVTFNNQVYKITRIS